MKSNKQIFIITLIINITFISYVKSQELRKSSSAFINKLSNNKTEFNELLNSLNKKGNEKSDFYRLWNYFDYQSEIDPQFDMKQSKELLNFSIKNNFLLGKIFANCKIGYDYRAFGNYSESLNYNLKSLNLVNEDLPDEIKAFAMLNLAHVYKDIYQYKDAMQLYQKVRIISKKLNNPKLEALSLINIGYIYLSENKLDISELTLIKANQLIDKNNYSFYRSRVNESLGKIYSKKKQTTKALLFFNNAKNEASKTNSPKYKNIAYTDLANFYKSQNQSDSSIYYAKKAYKAVEKTPFYIFFSHKSSKILADYYNKKNCDSCLKYTNIYLLAKDSIFKKKVIQDTQTLVIKASIEKEKEIELKRRNINYLIIGLGILTLIIFILFLSRSILSTTKLIKFLGIIALLFVFEFINLVIHPFLESVTNHSQIIILIIMVLIASILIPVHHYIQEKTLKKIIDDNEIIRYKKAKETLEELKNKIPERHK